MNWKNWASIDKNHNPRKGTETVIGELKPKADYTDKNHNPRKGTETYLDTLFNQGFQFSR